MSKWICPPLHYLRPFVLLIYSSCFWLGTSFLSHLIREIAIACVAPTDVWSSSARSMGHSDQSQHSRRHQWRPYPRMQWGYHIVVPAVPIGPIVRKDFGSKFGFNVRCWIVHCEYLRVHGLGKDNVGETPPDHFADAFSDRIDRDDSNLLGAWPPKSWPTPDGTASVSITAPHDLGLGIGWWWQPSGSRRSLPCQQWRSVFG